MKNLMKAGLMMLVVGTACIDPATAAAGKSGALRGGSRRGKGGQVAVPTARHQLPDAHEQLVKKATVPLPAESALPARRAVPHDASTAEAALIKHDNLLATLRSKHTGAGRHARLTRTEIRDLAKAKIAARLEEERVTHKRFTDRIRKGLPPARKRREGQTFEDARAESLQAFRTKLRGEGTKLRDDFNAAFKAAKGSSGKAVNGKANRRLWGKVGSAVENTFTSVADYFGGLWDDIEDGFDNMIDFLEDAGTYISNIDDHLEDLVTDIFEEVFEVIAVIMNGMADAASASINGAVSGCVEPIAGCVEDGIELASYEAFDQTIFSATLNNAEFKVCLNEISLDLNMDADKVEAFYNAIMDNVGDFASAVICPVTEGIMDVVDAIGDILEDVENTVDDLMGWIGVDRRRMLLAQAAKSGKHAAARSIHAHIQRRLDDALVVADYVNADYCTEALPCAAGFGDCDNDDQCAGTLKCYKRDENGPTPPGLSFTASQTSGSADYCYDASIAFEADDVGVDYCTEATPCYAGFGDCDNDDQCRGDLKCFQRDANGPTPPGLSFTASQISGNFDYCYDATISVAADYVNLDYCSEASPCYAGYGDCDSDDQCRGDLKCFQRDANGATPPGLTLTENLKATAIDFCYAADSGCPVASLSMLGNGIQGALRDLMADALVTVETYQLVDLELEVNAQAAYVAEGDVLDRVGSYKAVTVDVKVPVFTGILFGFSMELDVEVPWKVVMEAAATGKVKFHQGSTSTVGVALVGGTTRDVVQDSDNGLTFPGAIEEMQFSSSVGFGIKAFDLLFELSTFGSSVFLETSFNWPVMTVGIDVARPGTETSAASGYDLVGFPSSGGFLCTQATVWFGEPTFELGIGYDTVVPEIPCAADSLLNLGSGAITLVSIEGGGVLHAEAIPGVSQCVG